MGFCGCGANAAPKLLCNASLQTPRVSGFMDYDIVFCSLAVG